VEGWAERTPASFEFTVKMSRYITHIRRLTQLEEGVRRFYEPLEPLVAAGKLGPVLWQLPANFQRDDARLAAALEAAPAGRHAFEFRHVSWFTDEILGLLREHDAALVIGDHPERPFQPHELTTDWTFVRFHYGHRGRNGNYSRSELDTWRRRIAQWRRQAEVFAYFNNDWNAYAPRNAVALRDG